MRQLSMTPRAIRYRAAVAESILRCRCMDCGIDTLRMKGGGEYYMVHNALWLKANPHDTGMLCIGCLERRLGRKLTSGDFTHCPVNNVGRWNSARLDDRLATYKEDADV